MDGPQSVTDYQRLISEIIQKQVELLGAGIALSRVGNVSGLTVGPDGVVTAITGDPRETLQKVIDEFFVFSGLIVKKTMESLLANYPGMAGAVGQSVQEVKSNQNPPA